MDGFVFYFSFAAGRCSTQVVCTMRVSERERIHICRLPMCFVVVTIVCFTHTNEQRPDDEEGSYIFTQKTIPKDLSMWKCKNTRIEDKDTRIEDKGGLTNWGEEKKDHRGICTMGPQIDI